jgi:ATP-dependent Lon protease
LWLACASRHQFVQQEVAEYILRGDETEIMKSAIRERPPRRLIDLVKVELDERTDEGVYWAALITANIDHVRISSEIVTKYDRLLMAGAWCNLRVDYDDSFKLGRRTFPFVVQRLEPVQVGHVSLEEYLAGWAQFTRDEWIDGLIRTMGYEPSHPALTERIKLLYLTRMIPLVESNYHLIELGPRQTGKSFCFTEFSPYGTLLAGGAVTVPKLFVSNTNPPRLGLIAQRDVVGFDEVAAARSMRNTTRICTRATWRAARSTVERSRFPARPRSSSTATSISTPGKARKQSTCSSPCQVASPTTPPSTTAGRPTCPAGRCQR